MSQLTASEITFIDAFCKKKGIKYLDLRIELVDHLALQTETVLAKNVNFDFKQAFYSVYQSYGIFGFSELESQHQSLVFKRYRSEILGYFKTWLRPLKLVAAALFIYLIFNISQHYVFVRMPMLYVALGLYIITLAMSIFVFLRCKKRMQGEITLLMDVIYANLFLGMNLINPLCIFWRENDFSQSPKVVVVLFVLGLLFFLASYHLQKEVFKNVARLKESRFAGG